METLSLEALTSRVESLESELERSTWVHDPHPPEHDAERSSNQPSQEEGGADHRELERRRVGGMLEEMASLHGRIASVKWNLRRERLMIARNDAAGGCVASEDEEEERQEGKDCALEQQDDAADEDAASDESTAESLLDWAISSKKARDLDSSVLAHLMRMNVRPELAYTDAVRLLGLIGDVPPIPWSGLGIHFATRSGSERNKLVEGVGVEQRCTTGLFAVEGRPREEDRIYRPTRAARRLGRGVRRVFETRGYTLRRCRSFLIPFIETEVSEDRIFSGNSFFNHRHEVHRARAAREEEEEASKHHRPHADGLEVLTTLFLFGLAMRLQEVESALGVDDVDVLRRARLLRDCPGSSSSSTVGGGGLGLVVAEVQVFPLSRSDLHGHDMYPSSGASANDNGVDDGRGRVGRTYLFATDWPMESLRPTRDAVMAVGYDTLELCAVSAVAGDAAAAIASSTPAGSDEEKGPSGGRGRGRGRLLDLCCGCGIQGLFAWCCAREEDAGPAVADHDDGNRRGQLGHLGYEELVGIDINERACYFMSANAALNAIGDEDEGKPGDEGEGDVVVYAVHGDLYEPLRGKRLLFGRILSNPPFVAVPSRAAMPHLDPSLFAAGGIDGMVVLRRILLDCFDFLDHRHDEFADLLMVTEVPNVEHSCEMLRGCLSDKEQDNARVRVAYIESDVETVEEYCNEREGEAGNFVPDRDWKSPMLEEKMYNRALVLISISRIRGDRMSRLDKYVGKVVQEHDLNHHVGNVADEEDAFLTKDGISFARISLLL